jgi:hypothetical protein
MVPLFALLIMMGGYRHLPLDALKQANSDHIFLLPLLHLGGAALGLQPVPD